MTPFLSVIKTPHKLFRFFSFIYFEYLEKFMTVKLNKIKKYVTEKFVTTGVNAM